MPYDWYQAFFSKKVLPGLLREMKDCSGISEEEHSGFYFWLKDADRALYDDITLQDEKLLEIWQDKGHKERFKEACRAWVGAHLKAKPRYLAAMAEPQGSLL